MTNELVPHDYEAEEAVIASLIVDGDAWLPKVKGIITPADFWNPDYRTIFQAVLEVGAGIDQLTVGHALMKAGRTDLLPALSLAAGHLPTSVHCAYYAGIVRLCAYQRRLIEAAGQVAKVGYEGRGEVEGIHRAALQIIESTLPGRGDE